MPESIVRSGTGRPILALEDHTGEWWAPTSVGLYRFARAQRLEVLAHAQPKAVYCVSDGLASDNLDAAFEDSRGDLWFASGPPSREGLTRWERATGAFHRYSDRDGLSAFNPPSAISEDAAGNLWVGFYDGGLARYRRGRFTTFTHPDGIPAGAVWTIYLDHSGRLWIASSDLGLSRIEDANADRPRFVRYTLAPGLSNNIRCLTEDQWGRLYLGTARGVDRLEPATGRIKHYSTADGLAGTEMGAAFRDRSGALWFGTFQGLSRILPEPDPPLAPPPVLIGGLRISGVSKPVFELGENHIARRELEPDQNQVQIDFFGLSFGLGRALRYQHKLEGADRDWSVPAGERTVYYANLAPGVYRFLVRSVGPEGSVSPMPASVAFDILPPIWRRSWFRACERSDRIGGDWFRSLPRGPTFRSKSCA